MADVLDTLGNAIPGVSSITILPGVGAIVRVTIDGTNTDLHPLLSIQTLEQWAVAQGMMLTPIE